MPPKLTNFRIFYSKHGTRWRVWDFLVGLVAFIPGWYLSPHHMERVPEPYYMVIMGALHGVILAVMSRLTAVPNPEERSSGYELLAAASLAVLGSYLVFSLPVTLILVRTYGRYIVLTQLAISFVGVVIPRFLLMGFISRNPLKVVIYGAGQNGQKLLTLLNDTSRFRCLGFLDVDETVHQNGEQLGAPVLGSITKIGGDGLQALGTELVIVSVRAKNLMDCNAQVLADLPLHNIEVLNKGAFLEQHFKKVSVEFGCPQWFASSPSLPGNRSTFFFKRMLDVACAIPGLIISLPLWIPIAVGVKLTSPGPVFFTQKRVGFRGREFTMIKFRTMKRDAERNGAQWAEHRDPRVTSFGRFLRVTRLDELPQFVNVLLGQMTLVGPRPERPEFVEELTQEIPYYEHRYLVPPGLTGWAQVMYRYGASKEDALNKLEYDLYYVRHLSIMFDIEILLRTIPMIMKGSR